MYISRVFLGVVGEGIVGRWLLLISGLLGLFCGFIFVVLWLIRLCFSDILSVVSRISFFFF